MKDGDDKKRDRFVAGIGIGVLIVGLITGMFIVNPVIGGILLGIATAVVVVSVVKDALSSRSRWKARERKMIKEQEKGKGKGVTIDGDSVNTSKNIESPKPEEPVLDNQVGTVELSSRNNDNSLNSAEQNSLLPQKLPLPKYIMGQIILPLPKQIMQ